MLKYITNPIYERIVVLFPKWVAPNLITVTGLLFTLVSHALLAYYAPGLKDDPQMPTPSWVYFYSAIAVLAYQALDAMDGKQARRTGTGSPLGLLMDHGCDALNTTVMSLSVATALQLGSTINAVILWGIGALGFFFATLEEYYTGVLQLPWINGPNEGIHLMAIIFCLTGAYGPSFWSAPAPFGDCTRADVVVWLTVALGVATVAFNAYNIATVVREKKRTHDVASRAEEESISSLVAATRSVPLFLSLSLVYVWAVYSPSDILSRYPRELLWVCGLVVVKLDVGIMVAHLCEQEYHPFTRTMCVFLFLAAHGAGLSLWSRYNDDALQAKHEDIILAEMGILLVFSIAHMVASLAHEVSSILGIWVFTITSKRTTQTPHIRRLLRLSIDIGHPKDE